MEEKVQKEQEMEEENSPMMGNGTRTREMLKKSIKPRLQQKIRRGEIVLRSSPFAFVILATHR